MGYSRTQEKMRRDIVYNLDVLEFIVDIFTCIGIVVATLEFCLSKRAVLAESERIQKQDTISFFMSVKDDLYMYNHSIYERYRNEKIVYAEVKDDKEFILILKNYLNTMEIVATGINTGVYNINVFDRLYGDACVRYADQLQDYITSRRMAVGHPEMYVDYDLLVIRLKEIHKDNRELLNSNAIIKNTVSRTSV